MTENEATGAKRRPKYEPLTQLATGGMAEIWLARERGVAGLERFVVLKRLLPHLASDRNVVEMFVSEARFVARLVHPNVVQIHELAEDDQGYFLVMEYVEGCTVRELMSSAEKSKRQVPAEVGVCIIEQACRGAHAAHELTDGSGRTLGLVHRDISPHNLMISPSGDVKLLDFGIAKATALAEATHTGSLKGKFGYMSPEQCRARRLDRRSDVFALGVVLWELLAAKRLFVRDSEFESMQAIVSGEHLLPSAVRTELPPALDAVVSKALQKDASDRFQTAEELRVALLAAAEEAGLKSSRDAVGAALAELLGDRIEQRSRALREAAERNTDAIDRGALHAALVGPDSSEQRSGSKSFTGRSVRASDDGATVVQRRSSRPAGKDDGLAQSGDRASYETLDRPSELDARDHEPTIDRTPFDKTFSEPAR
ncbi:MAG: serine/threonine protein kinase, partial [Deltaproteobacteria bacterium]|nr:serine/threonine protein kinase [Deltaproteobacteria bacterium]